MDGDFLCEEGFESAIDILNKYGFKSEKYCREKKLGYKLITPNKEWRWVLSRGKDIKLNWFKRNDLMFTIKYSARGKKYYSYE
jgi:hypothetical protein